MDDQKYNAWLIWDVTTRCNLSCVYCCKIQNKQRELLSKDRSVITKRIADYFIYRIAMVHRLGLGGSMAIPIQKFKYRSRKNKLEKINIKALMASLDRTKRTFRIIFSGGEPFLIPNFIEACVELTQKHYIGINSNFTSETIKEFCQVIDPKKVTNLNASLHTKELEKYNLIDAYISNFLEAKKKGFNVISLEVAYPPLSVEVKKYREFLKHHGIELVFSHFFGEYNGKQYPAAYTEDENNVFELNGTKSLDIKSFYQTGNLCNAGYNAGIVDPDGTVRRCYHIGEVHGNIYTGIRFENKMIKCPREFCACPLNIHEPYLFEKAIEGIKSS